MAHLQKHNRAKNARNRGKGSFTYLGSLFNEATGKIDPI